MKQFSIHYRPHTLDEVVGQTNVIASLKKRTKTGKWPRAMIM